MNLNVDISAIEFIFTNTDVRDISSSQHYCLCTPLVIKDPIFCFGVLTVPWVIRKRGGHT